MCPSCEQGILQPTGAFWVCHVCGLAITQQALAFARARPPAPDGRKRDPSGNPSSPPEAEDVQDRGEEPRG